MIKDQFFTSEILEKIFGADILGSHTLGGTLSINGETGKAEIVNVLDKTKLAYAQSLLRIRAEAVGINAEEREARHKDRIFNGYVKLAAEKYKKRLLRKKSKKDDNDDDQSNQEDDQISS
jgi:predicted ribonuclease YlaK